MTTIHVDMFTQQSQVFYTVAYTIYRGPITSPTRPITLTTRIIVKRALAHVVR